MGKYVDTSALGSDFPPRPDAFSHLFPLSSCGTEAGQKRKQSSSTQRLVTDLFAPDGDPYGAGPGSRGDICEERVVPEPTWVVEPRERYYAREYPSDKRDKVVAMMDFRSLGGFFAAATSAKEVCIHKLRGIRNSGSDCEDEENGEEQELLGSSSGYEPRWVHRTSAKLSALCWNNHSNAVTVGDHLGELTRVDVETCHILTEVDEGSATAVLDLKKNCFFGTGCVLTAAKGGDCRLWSEDLRDSLLVTPEGGGCGAACACSFSPTNPNWVAVAMADSTVSVYDVRNPGVAMWSAETGMGGGNAAAHLDYCANGDLVCSTLSEGIAVWGASGWRRTYKDHTQMKRFVGMAARGGERGDLVATGSEDGKAYVYDCKSGAASAVAVCQYATGSAPLSEVPSLESCCQSKEAGVTAVSWIPGDLTEGSSAGLLVARGASILRFQIDQPSSHVV